MNRGIVSAVIKPFNKHRPQVLIVNGILASTGDQRRVEVPNRDAVIEPGSLVEWSVRGLTAYQRKMKLYKTEYGPLMGRVSVEVGPFEVVHG